MSVAYRLEDLPWFARVVEHSEAILVATPEDQLSAWYLKYPSTHPEGEKND